MGLWDYDDDVEEYQREEPSSPSCVSEEDDVGTKSKKGGRKKQVKVASKKRALPAKSSKFDSKDEALSVQDDDVVVIDDDSEDELMRFNSKKSKKTPSAQPSKQQPSPIPIASPGEYLDSETSKKLKQNDELLRRLEAATNEDADDLDCDEPADVPCQTYTSFLPTMFKIHRPDPALPSTSNPTTYQQPPEPQPATAATEPAVPGADKADGGQDGGPQITISLQSKHGKLKIRLHAHKPFSVMMARYREHAEKMGWLKAGQAVKLIFDGDVVSEDSTAEEFDMEGDETMDVVY